MNFFMKLFGVGHVKAKPKTSTPGVRPLTEREKAIVRAAQAASGKSERKKTII